MKTTEFTFPSVNSAISPKPITALVIEARSLVRVPCGDQTLRIDWSKASGDTALFQWENVEASSARFPVKNFNPKENSS